MDDMVFSWWRIGCFLVIGHEGVFDRKAWIQLIKRLLLENVTLAVSPGERLLVVLPAGGGKSLFFGSYKELSGKDLHIGGYCLQ